MAPSLKVQPPANQSSIQAFTRLAKVAVEAPEASKKRKVTFEEDTQAPSTVNKRCRSAQFTPTETPTKACKRALATLALQTPSPALKGIKRKRASQQKILTEAISSPPTPPPSHDSSDVEDVDMDMPNELHELVGLNDAFLSALSLHCAHNGASMTVDVRTLTPSITKLWGRRKVGIDDLRLCIGVLNGRQPIGAKGSGFFLTNLGNGRIHLNMQASTRRAGRVIGQPFSEKQLRRLFSERVESSWRSWVSTADGETSWDDFKQRLPVAEVKLSASAVNSHPLLAKGQQRLDSLTKPKDPALSSPNPKKQRTVQSSTLTEITNKQNLASPLIASAQSSPGKENAGKPDLGVITATIRGLSLFERIREKELLQASMPRPPTKDELDHQSALQRAEEMLSILDMLATSKGSGVRATFPLPSLIRSVQSSIRSPMAKDEIERCVRVLEQEVSPGYVSMIKFGGIVGVVVNRLVKPSEADVKQRLATAGVQ